MHFLSCWRERALKRSAFDAVNLIGDDHTSTYLNQRHQLNFPSSSGKPRAACAGASLVPRRDIAF
jgi:hypothetical protein